MSYADIESTIHRSSIMITSNDNNISKISGFRFTSNITIESNSKNDQKLKFKNIL